MDLDNATDAPAVSAELPQMAEPRDDDGRFRPGVSGNPRGRPPGSRSALHLARTLAEAGIAAVVIMERPGIARPTSTRRPRRLAT